MGPVIKWPGGKSGEIKHIETMIPNGFNRYFEPFFGGGAIFFHLEPPIAVINDISQELMLIYKYISDGNHRSEFRRELYEYIENWERISVYLDKFGKLFQELYNEYKNGSIGSEELELKISAILKSKMVDFNGMFMESFCVDREHFLAMIRSNLIDKFKRMKKLDLEHNFTGKMIKENIETAFRSAFYIHFRDIMNKEKTGKLTLKNEKKIANYYFIREFCFGGMFRFNEDREFNVPYGGINYNRKNFRKKVERLFSEKVRKLLENASIESTDFVDLFKKYSPTREDFIFLDPPYDTEFSDYEENPFTKDDQERLANFLLNTKAKFILIIKETEFIRRLYDNKGLSVHQFGKTYKYNIKSRFERKVRHLIVHNLEDRQRRLT